MKKIKNLTKRIFNAKRVGTLAMLLFCGVAATYAQNAAGDYIMLRMRQETTQPEQMH